VKRLRPSALAWTKKKRPKLEVEALNDQMDI